MLSTNTHVHVSHLQRTPERDAVNVGGGGTGRLPVATVQRMERPGGGDPVTEGQILRFIAGRSGAKSLVYLPTAVAAEVCRRPRDFVRAARRYCEPELSL